jgi:hypothetical protein
MAPRSWEEYALEIARNGDQEAPARQELYREQVNQCMDGMSSYTLKTASEEVSSNGLTRY